MKRHLELLRLSDDGHQTLGVLYVIEGNKILFECKTLELPYLNNKNKISCIPPTTDKELVPKGKYKVTKRKTKYSRFKYEHLLINDVPNRDYILIHGANYYTELLGCVAVGNKFKDINGDNLDDVLNSLNTLETLLTYIPEEGIDLKIYYR